MNDARPILLVDDDPVLGMMLPEDMREAGFDAVVCGSLAEANHALSAQEARFSAIIMDVLLPDGDGREFCRELRQRKMAMPIVMLSGLAGETDIVAALDGGACDYVVKPFGVAELMARLRAVLRADKASKDACFDISGFEFRPAVRMWTVPGGKQRPVRMTNKECQLLHMLHQADGQTVTRETLLAAICGFAKTALTHTLESHVYRLRQKIEPDPSEPTIILRSSGGYRLGLGAGFAVRPVAQPAHAKLSPHC